MFCAERRRIRRSRTLKCRIVRVLAISPTMQCNYNCMGCYSHGRPSKDELSTDELDRLFYEAEHFGVLAIILTGGEPLIRGDILHLINKHSRLFFVLITNGSLMTPEIAVQISKSGNIVTLISLEGNSEHTDFRRGEGKHKTALEALELLQNARACSGFATTVTSKNERYISTDEFIDKMLSLGCSIGYFVEYVPCGENAEYDLVMDHGSRASFRKKVLDLRRRKRLVLIHFPDDEYGKENRCSAAGRASLHISSQGDVEPCPFVSISCDNIRNGGLRVAFESQFLQKIRTHPYLLRRDKFACALFEHKIEIENLALKSDQ